MAPLRIRIAWLLTILFAPAGLVAGIYLLTRDDVGHGLAVCLASLVLIGLGVALVA